MLAHSHRVSQLHSVFERAMHEQRRALAAWAAALAGYSAMMLAVYPTVHGNASFAKLVESYPKAFRKMFAIADFTTGPGYLRGEIFSLMGPLLVLILAVLWGSDVIAGEEERGTIDILLANPITRRRLIAEKWAAIVVGLGLVSAVFAVVFLAGGPLVDLNVGIVRLTAAVVATAMLAILYGTVALALSAATGRRGVARGLTAVLAVAAYLVSSLANLVSWFRPLRPLSPWYHALGIDPLTAGFTWHLSIIAALTLVVGVVALVAFERRDLAVS